MNLFLDLLAESLMDRREELISQTAVKHTKTAKKKKKA